MKCQFHFSLHYCNMYNLLLKVNPGIIILSRIQNIPGLYLCSVSFTAALPLCPGRLRQCELQLSVSSGRWWAGPVIVASRLDVHRTLRLCHLAGVPRELRCDSAGVALVDHLRASEELPPRTSRAVPPGRGSPGLRDGRAVPQTTQNVDGTQPGQGGTLPVSSTTVIQGRNTIV